MPSANPVRWFEIPVTNMERARAFYAEILGFELPVTEFGPDKMAWFPMERDAYGAGGTLVQGQMASPSQAGVTIYFAVDAIDPIVGKIGPAGGELLMPRTSIGEYGFIAMFKDTEGNRIGLHENVPM